MSCPRLVSLFQLSTSQSLVLLEILHIENCEGLENIIEDERRELESREEIDGDDNDNKSHGSMFPKLQFLHIEGCPLLEYILPFLSAQDLQVLERVLIEKCDGLKYIFVQHVELGSVTHLQLNYLPNFIGIFRECYHSMPSCVKKGSPSTSNCGSKAQTELKPIKCSIFSWTHVCCHGNKFRHKLGSTATTTIPLVDGDQPQQDHSESNSYCSDIWECPQCLSRKSKILRNIEQLQYLHVPKIKSIFIPSTLLELLVVRKCDELKHIIIDTGDHGSDGNSWGNVFPKLRTLTVENCVQLEYIFEHYIDDHQNPTGIHLQLPALEIFHLRNLPSLVAMCPKQYHTTISSLKELVFSECSQVAIQNIGDFITDHSISRSVDGTIMKELSGNIEHFLSLGKMVVKNSKVESIFCLDEVNEQQLTLSLTYLELQDLPVMTCLFVGPKNSFALQTLGLLKIVGCEKLEIVFSTSILRCLPELQYLIIKDCKELKHIIKDEVENIKGSNYVTSRTSFPILKLLVVINCTKLKYLFPTSVCKELPELEALMIREADELEEIFKNEGDDQKVEIPNLNVVAFVDLPSLCQTQGIQFQDVGNRFVQNCQKLSLTSTSRANSISDINDINFNSDHELREDFLNLFEQLHEESEGEDSCNEYSVDLSDEIEVEAASAHGLTSSQIQMKQTLEAEPEFVEDDPDLEITSIAILPTTSEELVNEQSLDQQCLMNQQLPLGETDTTIKHFPGNNLEGSTSEKITLLTHLELVSSSSGPIVTFEHKSSSQEYGDGQTAIPSLSISTTEPLTIEDFDNDQGSLNDNPHMKVNSNIEEQFPMDDEIIVSKSILSSTVSQCPNRTEVQATSKHELTSSHENCNESNVVETKMKQTEERKKKFVANIPGLEIHSVANSPTNSQELLNEQSTSQQCLMDQSIQDGSTIQKTVATTFATVSETRNESTIQLAAPKQKVIKLTFEDTTTIAYAKTITSPTHSEPNISSSGPLVTYEHKTSSHGIEISVEEGSASTHGKTEDGDGKICIPSFSTVNTKPPATKDVDIGDSQETTHEFYDSAMKDINKLIEEDPLLALEKLLTGQVPISSIQILLQELKTLMDSSSNLDHLVSNQASKSKLISLLHQLNEHQGMLTSELKNFVEKVQNFFNDNIIKHATSQQVFNKHNQLLALKTDLMNKLWSAKSTQTHIESESSTANAKIHELSLQIDDLKSVVNKCDVQKEKLKAECTEWAQQSKELVSVLASSAVDVREAELARNFASEGFANLKSSFPTF